MADTPQAQTFGSEGSFDFGRDILGGIRQSWAEGLQEFQNLLERAGIAGVASGGKPHNAVVFHFFAGGKLSWIASENVFLTGAIGYAGLAVSLNGTYANYAAITAV